MCFLEPLCFFLEPVQGFSCDGEGKISMFGWKKKTWTCVHARVRSMSMGLVLVWILLCCQIAVRYTILNRSRRKCHKDKGLVVKKTHEPVCMWECGSWAWGGCWCEYYVTVRYTILNRSRRIIMSNLVVYLTEKPRARDRSFGIEWETFCCLLLIDKTRAKYRTYVRV